MFLPLSQEEIIEFQHEFESSQIGDKLDFLVNFSEFSRQLLSISRKIILAKAQEIIEIENKYINADWHPSMILKLPAENISKDNFIVDVYYPSLEEPDCHPLEWVGSVEVKRSYFTNSNWKEELIKHLKVE